MTAHPRISERTLQIAARVQALVDAELVRMRGVEARLEQARQVDADIMTVCRAVGQAVDSLAQARFSGVAEVSARRRLEQAARRMTTLLKKHGRIE